MHQSKVKIAPQKRPKMSPQGLCAFAALFLSICDAQDPVAVWLSAQERGANASRLQRMPDIAWSASPSPDAARVSVNCSDKRQQLLGFGGAVTDSAAFVFNSLQQSEQDEVIELLYGDTGNKLTMMRIPIGPSDFATSVYSYDEADKDYGMSNFTVSHDEAYTLPMIQRALGAASEAGREVKVLVSPWTAPSWLKRNKAIRNSLKPGLVQTTESFQAYTQYLLSFVDAYAEHGVNVWAMTVQNEPHVGGQFAFTYPCMQYEGSDEGSFLVNYLGPAMALAHPEIKIFIHDDQKAMDGDDESDKNFMLDRVNSILSARGSESTTAANFSHGVAFHWYGANLHNYDALAKLHEEHPELMLLATEATLKWPSARKWQQAVKYAIDIIGDINQWTSGWIEWNVLLDGLGGPTCIGPSIDTAHTSSTACEWLHNHSFGACDAPIRAIQDPLPGNKHSLFVGDQYYMMGHFSRFFPTGSRIVSTGISNAPNSTAAVSEANLSTSGNIGANLGTKHAFLNRAPSPNPAAIAVAAALTPDGGVAIVCLSTLTEDTVLALDLAGYSAAYEGQYANFILAAESIVTLIVPSV